MLFDYNVKNDNASSLEVLSGYKVTLYENPDGTGKQLVIDGDTEYNVTGFPGRAILTKLDFNDIASSLKIEKKNVQPTATSNNSTCGATPGDDEVYIYEHIFSQDKGGKCVKLTAGEYKDAAATGLADNIMSSIRVGKDVHAVVCEEANFGGACMAFDKDDDNFTNNATLKNDTATSVKIVKAEVCSPKVASQPVELNWTNKTDKSLRIVWINYDCKLRNDPREVEREIKPGETFKEKSFVGHIFNVADFKTGVDYGHIYVTDSYATQEIKDIK